MEIGITPITIIINNSIINYKVQYAKISFCENCRLRVCINFSYPACAPLHTQYHPFLQYFVAIFIITSPFTSPKAYIFLLPPILHLFCLTVFAIF